MLRFGNQLADKKTAFEKFTCLGEMWSYNLFKLRPTAYEGFLSQILGKKNINNNCSDFKQRPLWSYMSKEGFSTGIFESGATKNETIERAWKCQEESTDFTKNLFVWRMIQPPYKSANSFHYQEKMSFTSPKFYYDKSCTENVCFSEISSNVKTIYENFSIDRAKSIFIFRDFSYAHALKKKNIVKAREVLNQIEKVVAYFQEIQKSDDRVLLLVTSSEARNFEFPKKGKEWSKFERSGKFVTFQNSSLLSMALASGARSENFCGYFDEANIMERIMWQPEEGAQSLELIKLF